MTGITRGHDVNRHDASIRAFCITYDQPLDWDRFNAWIEMLITLYGPACCASRAC